MAAAALVPTAIDQVVGGLKFINDTHNCLLWAHVKNGVVTRVSPTYGYGKATDLLGNESTARWDPRRCQNGLELVRRFYGDRRIRKPMARSGFRSWIQAGCPRDAVTGAVDHKYLIAPSEVHLSLLVAATAWSVAFALYLWIFAPWLVRPRIDGNDG